MMMQFDPDEYEMIVESRPCASCGGDLKRCNGMCTGSVMVGQRRRPQEEIDRRRAERERLRDMDDRKYTDSDLSAARAKGREEAAQIADQARAEKRAAREAIDDANISPAWLWPEQTAANIAYRIRALSPSSPPGKVIDDPVALSHALDEHRQKMTEKVVPAIANDLREATRTASELRHPQPAPDAEIARLRAAIQDIFNKAAPYTHIEEAGEQWISSYLIPSGCLHRAIGLAGRLEALSPSSPGEPAGSGWQPTEAMVEAGARWLFITDDCGLWAEDPGPHSGDCTGLCHTCRLCLQAEYLGKARGVLTVASRLPAPPHEPTGETE